MNGQKIPINLRIKELRKNKGITQKDLAHDLGIDNKMISFYENGKSIPSIDVLIKIARIFNVSVDYLIFDDTPKRPFKQTRDKELKKLNIIQSIKWQFALVIIISLSFLISGNFLIYKFNKEELHNRSLKKIGEIVEKINISIENIKYGSKIIAHDQTVIKWKSDLIRPNNNKVTIVLNTVKTIFDASIVYTMDANGTVIASTIYNDGKTLTGNNYRFRPYFTEAMNNSPSVYPALGITTNERGIYYSYPIHSKNQLEPDGVAVIKMGVQNIEKIINLSENITGLMSPDGVIFISNKNEWLYKTALPIEEYKIEKLRKNKQFAGKPLDELRPLFSTNNFFYNNIQYSLTQKEITLPGWKVFMLSDETVIFPFKYSILITTLIIILSLTLIYLIFINQKKKIIENKKIIAVKNLNDSEEKYQIVFENTGTATIIYGNDKIITMCNSKFEQLSGYEKHDIEGKMKWSDFVRKEDMKNLEEIHEKRGKNKPVPTEYEFKFIDRYNNEKDIYIKVGIIQGSMDRVASMLDITEMKSVLRELKSVKTETVKNL